MPSDAPGPTNWFDRAGAAYARFRPHYPAALAAYLGQIAPDNRQALDVGCGSGQLTRLLAVHFDAVTGVDPSAGQIANAAPTDRVRYLVAPAEALPLPDASISLITAAQAAHWFDLAAFYAEVRRVAVEGAVIALVSYGVMCLGSAPVQARFARFYSDEIGPFWPPERRLVESGYAGIEFPFAERQPPVVEIVLDWDLAAFLGYVSTWSAVRRAAEAGQNETVQRFSREIAAVWGDPGHRHRVCFPVNMRLGTV